MPPRPKSRRGPKGGRKARFLGLGEVGREICPDFMGLSASLQLQKSEKTHIFRAEVMARRGPNRLSDFRDGWPRRPLSATRRVIHGSASQEISTDNYAETSCRQSRGIPRDVKEADRSRARRSGRSGDQAS